MYFYQQSSIALLPWGLFSGKTIEFFADLSRSQASTLSNVGNQKTYEQPRHTPNTRDVTFGN
jgi:hypothetical protein